jgi:hypothetical protein
VNEIARARRTEELRSAKERRFETAIICTYLAKTFGGKKTLSVKSVYEGMKIRDPDEERMRRRYKGTLREQIEAHERWLEERGNHAGNH